MIQNFMIKAAEQAHIQWDEQKPQWMEWKEKKSNDWAYWKDKKADDWADWMD